MVVIPLTQMTRVFFVRKLGEFESAHNLTVTPSVHLPAMKYREGSREKPVVQYL